MKKDEVCLEDQTEYKNDRDGMHTHLHEPTEAYRELIRGYPGSGLKNDVVVPRVSRHSLHRPSRSNFSRRQPRHFIIHRRNSPQTLTDDRSFLDSTIDHTARVLGTEAIFLPRTVDLHHLFPRKLQLQAAIPDSQ